jgi:hypothetical protein
MSRPPANSRPSVDAALSRMPNPFESSVVSNAHEEEPCDVPSLHSEAYDALLRHVERSRADGRSRIVVVLGDPGQGKTHLLRRLRRGAESSFRTAAPFSVGIVRPLRDPLQPYLHVFREATSSLSRPLPYLPDAEPDDVQPTSQLERLAWLALGRVTRALAAFDDTLAAIVPPSVERGIATFGALARSVWSQQGDALLDAAKPWAIQHGIEPGVLRAIGRLPLKASRHGALAWLRGVDLSEEETRRFGLPASVISEDDAFRALTSIARLGVGPLVLGFDQLEGIRRLGVEPARQFFQALVELFSQDRGQLVLAVFCQSSIWPELRAEQEQQVLDRLERDILLAPVSPSDVRALCAQRLAAACRGEGLSPPHPYYPFGEADLDALSAGVVTPRQALRELAARFEAWRRAPARKPRRGPRALFDGALARAPRDLSERTPETRADGARTALTTLLAGAEKRGLSVASAAVSGVTTQPLRTSQAALRLTLSRGSELRRTYVEASNSLNGRSAAATLLRLVKSTEGRAPEADRSVLLRERGAPLPRAAQEMLDTAPRTTVVWLDPDDLLPLSALEVFLDEAAENELTLEEVERFVAELAPSLPVTSKLVEAVFAERVGPSPLPDPLLMQRIELFLVEKRSIVGRGELAEALGAAGEHLGPALDALAASGRVTLAHDRARESLVIRRT